MGRRKSSLGILALGLTVASCYSTGDGTAPPLRELYYPVGLQVSAGGTVLYESGSDPRDFFVVLDGEVEVVRPGDDEVRVATWGPGGFLGELNLLTGQRPLMTARMLTDGRVLAIDLDTFRRLMSTHPEFSDVVFRAFLARRGVLRAGDHQAGWRGAGVVAGEREGAAVEEVDD